MGVESFKLGVSSRVRGEAAVAGACPRAGSSVRTWSDGRRLWVYVRPTGESRFVRRSMYVSHDADGFVFVHRCELERKWFVSGGR